MAERFRPFRFSRAGLRGLKVSATLSLNERVRELWEAGRDVYHLGFGESRFPVHPKIAEALEDRRFSQKKEGGSAVLISQARPLFGRSLKPLSVSADCLPIRLLSLEPG